ncbi:transposase [Candidatus Woesearchaeota archaeon]|nr:transposase [Candidatus Woesearchaeota archaeon]
MSSETKPESIIELFSTGSGQTTFQPIIEKELKEVEKPKSVVKKPKPTYRQDWKAYDSARTNEAGFFRRLLDELTLIGINEVPKTSVGRKGFSIREKIISMAIKVYYKSDLRKAESILKELQKTHFIYRVPSYRSIDNFFQDKSLSKVLDKLIFLSALPLASLEETAAIDATGFTTTIFTSWNKFKWGNIEGEERAWRKLHAVIGCKTNIFISAEVTEGHVHDSLMVKEIVDRRVIAFDLQKFVADKAYLSRDTLEFINGIGLLPFIPFKKNCIGRSRGSPLWKKLFAEFTYNYESFMNNYHARSQIETSFHMLKARLGNNCATRGLNANINEIKTKVLCHNLCVLIQEAFENNIFVDFEACEKIATPVKK